MKTLAYLVAAVGLIAVTFTVFRVIVRRQYACTGRLPLWAGLLELLPWTAYLGFPYLYNPPEWVRYWSNEVPVGPAARAAGVACITTGLLAAFGTMLWFGLGRAFGLQAENLIDRGPYRLTRNPQLVFGTLLVVGTVVLWPSWYAAGWVLLYAAVGHLMVITEEEHLRRVFGEAYADYCRRVPRYVGRGCGQAGGATG